ncbi:RING finger protein 227-like [Pseudophryne corroboree]|uniref:RING finger protein 227-like n=1 Tax=Pseudophryne corroboree TaxID=495146 RepID=UPI003081BACD
MITHTPTAAMLTDTLPAALPDLDMAECGICYHDYGQARKPRPLPTCRHVLCSVCLDHLTAHSGEVTCPFCRASSPLPSDEEEGAGDVTGKGPIKWLKRLYRKSKAGSRRRASLANEDIRDIALMSSYFM